MVTQKPAAVCGDQWDAHQKLGLIMANDQKPTRYHMS